MTRGYLVGVYSSVGGLARCMAEPLTRVTLVTPKPPPRCDVTHTLKILNPETHLAPGAPGEGCRQVPRPHAADGGAEAEC